MTVLRRADRVLEAFIKGEEQWIHLEDDEYQIIEVSSLSEKIIITYEVETVPRFYDDVERLWIAAKVGKGDFTCYSDDYVTIY